MAEQRGPGHTSYIANEDGSISRRRWNDPAWTNHLVGANPSAWKIASLLREAYLDGLRDKAEQFRRVIGNTP